MILMRWLSLCLSVSVVKTDLGQAYTHSRAPFFQIQM